MVNCHKHQWILRKNEAVIIARDMKFNRDDDYDLETFRLFIFVPSRNFRSLKFLINDNLQSDRILLSDREAMIIHEVQEPSESFDLKEIKLDSNTLVHYISILKTVWLRFIGVQDSTWIKESLQLDEVFKSLLLKHIIERNLNHTRRIWKLLKNLDGIEQFVPDWELIETVG